MINKLKTLWCTSKVCVVIAVTAFTILNYNHLPSPTLYTQDQGWYLTHLHVHQHLASQELPTDWYWCNEWINLWINAFLVSMDQTKHVPRQESETEKWCQNLWDHFTPIRMTITKKKKKNKTSVENVEEWESLYKTKFECCGLYFVKQKFAYKIWELFCSRTP